MGCSSDVNAILCLMMSSKLASNPGLETWSNKKLLRAKNGTEIPCMSITEVHRYWHSCPSGLYKKPLDSAWF